MNDTCNAHIIAATAALAEKRRVVAQGKKPSLSSILQQPCAAQFMAPCVCEPKTADGNKLCGRPNTVADQHYVESGLLPPSDRNAAVRKQTLQVLFEYAQTVITVKTLF